MAGSGPGTAERGGLVDYTKLFSVKFVSPDPKCVFFSSGAATPSYDILLFDDQS